VSDALRHRVREQSPWYFPDSSVVHSGVDLEVFRADPADRPPPAGKDAWGWRALFAGRIDPRKGIDTVLRAFALLDARATLQVLGRGDPAHLAELVALAHELGIEGRVSFGQASREDLASSYRQADVVLFASTWEEPFGLVPLEAMACGTPVVATATGGAAEYLVDGRNCLVCPAGDAAGMAGLVHLLASDPAIREHIVAGGKATARELGVDKLADLLLAQHETAASGAGTAGTADPGKSGSAPAERQERHAPAERQERQPPPLP
jgi:glycosyltransferase involved in cell wall biosynthesis